MTAGVVPFENSTNGSVVFTLDNLADRDGRYHDISVYGEIFVDVHHCLVGHKNPSSLPEDLTDSGTCTPTVKDPIPLRPKAKPLTSLKHVKRLYSHPQAFGQCNAFISSYLKGVEIVDTSSTSKAAEIVSQDKTGTWAAISSELAANIIEGLDILAPSIEDRDDNTTRFLIIGRKYSGTKDWNIVKQPERKSGTKSLISVTVPHTSPGALAEVLGGFKTFNLNLTSINSRPSLLAPFQYIFFIEFEGHREHDPDGRVKGALDIINDVSQSWRWLGSWERYR